MNGLRMMDAQVAMSFAISQASRINTQAYETKYPDIRYRGLVPVDTTGPEWVKSITYFSLDGYGAAQWQHAAADDVPLVGLNRSKSETTVAMAAIGYGWNLEELNNASMLGVQLEARKGRVARRASEEFVDKVVLYGDNDVGFFGLANQPGIVRVDAAATGTGSSTLWKNKTPDQIMADINGLVIGVRVSSKQVETIDTLLVPYTALYDLSTRRLSEHNETTVLDWIRRNNAYTMETGQQLTIRGVRGYETSGQGGVGRVVAYRNSDEVFRLNMPMPFRFFPVWQAGPFRFEVPGMMRLGGVDVSLPAAYRYLDGVC